MIRDGRVCEQFLITSFAGKRGRVIQRRSYYCCSAATTKTARIEGKLFIEAESEYGDSPGIIICHSCCTNCAIMDSIFGPVYFFYTFICFLLCEKWQYLLVLKLEGEVTPIGTISRAMAE